MTVFSTARHPMDDPGVHTGLIPHRLFHTLVQLVRSKDTDMLDQLLKTKSPEVGEIKELFHRKLERVKVRRNAGIAR